MEKKIFRFLGCSGTFKGTTICGLMRGARLGYCIPVFSPIKPWKRHFGKGGVLEGVLGEGHDNLDLAGLSLVTLEQALWQTRLDPDLNTIFVERSVLDNLFYWCKSTDRFCAKDKETRYFIKKVREEELEIMKKYDVSEFKNTILYMEDTEFIEKEILKEPTRREWFPTVGDYLHFENEYLEFMKKYLGTKMLWIRRIGNAVEYLEKIKRGEMMLSEKLD